jgi:hypothetical protein
MNQGGSVIRTALTTRLRLELTYREHRSEPAAADGHLDEFADDYDFVMLSDSGDRLKLPVLRAL